MKYGFGSYEYQKLMMIISRDVKWFLNYDIKSIILSEVYNTDIAIKKFKILGVSCYFRNKHRSILYRSELCPQPVYSLATVVLHMANVETRLQSAEIQL